MTLFSWNINRGHLYSTGRWDGLVVLHGFTHMFDFLNGIIGSLVLVGTVNKSVHMLRFHYVSFRTP